MLRLCSAFPDKTRQQLSSTSRRTVSYDQQKEFAKKKWYENGQQMELSNQNV